MTGPAGADPQSVASMPLVIRVEKNDPPLRLDALEAAAIAALRLWRLLYDGAEEHGPVLRTWIDHPRKVVRRARGSVWRRLLAQSPVHVAVRTAEVLAFPVMRRAELPELIEELPVTGTVLKDSSPESAASIPKCAGLLWVNPSLDMTAGKAMAQTGHGSLAFWHSLDEPQRSRWLAAGEPLVVRPADPGAWHGISSNGDLVVRDAGYTEIPNGSLTIVVDLSYLE